MAENIGWRPLLSMRSDPNNNFSDYLLLFVKNIFGGYKI